jgi:hypothetical protein
MQSSEWALLQQIAADVAATKKMVAQIYTKEMIFMATLDQVLAVVNDEKTQEASLVVLLNGIKAQLTAALANVGITPAQQLQIDTIFATATANDTAIVTAINANTTPPPAPDVPPAPVVPAI